VNKLRMILGSLLILAGAALFAWTAFPLPQISQQLSLGGLPQSAHQDPGLWWETRTVTITYPSSLRLGETARLRLLAVPAGKVADAAPPFLQFAVLAEASPDLPGTPFAPEGVLSQAWVDGETLEFSWQLRGANLGAQEGRLWFSLRLVPRDGSQETRYPLLAVPLEFEVVALFGLELTTLRVIGGLLAAAGLVLLAWRGRFNHR
jgi:hypothetical protein